MKYLRRWCCLPGGERGSPFDKYHCAFLALGAAFGFFFEVTGLPEFAAVLSLKRRLCLLREELSTDFQGVSSLTRGEESVIANAVKSQGHDVEQESADELEHIERHELHFAVIRVVLASEGNGIAVHGDQPVVGNGDAVYVPREIPEHTIRVRERTLEIDDPLVPAGLIKVRFERFGVGKLRNSAVESEISFGKSPFEEINELAPKDGSDDFERQEELFGSGNPLGSVGGKTSGGDDEMDMRVVAERLPPCVQNAEKADFSSEVSGISGELQQRFCSRTKEDSVDGFFVLVCYEAEFFRNRKHNMEVLNG